MENRSEHIKMCLKAVEIQEPKKKALKLVCGYHHSFGDGFMSFYGETYCWDEDSDKVIYIPSALELLDMLAYDGRHGDGYKVKYKEVGHNHGCYVWVIKKVLEWFEESELRFIIPYPSMEQLWLAFVMFEKFNKTWNGEDWEEIK